MGGQPANALALLVPTGSQETGAAAAPRGNGGIGLGGSIFNAAGGKLTISGSEISLNTARGGNGGAGARGFLGSGGNGGDDAGSGAATAEQKSAGRGQWRRWRGCSRRRAVP